MLEAGQFLLRPGTLPAGHLAGVELHLFVATGGWWSIQARVTWGGFYGQIITHP